MEYTFQEMPDMDKTGERKVYPKAIHCSRIQNDFFMGGLSHRTTYGVGTIEGVVNELTEELDAYLTNGHSVKVDGLGTFNIALGMKDGREAETLKEAGDRYDTNGVYIKTINFIPDPRWLYRLRRRTELHKVGEVKALHPHRNTLEERRQMVLEYLDHHPYITVRVYMHLAYVPHTRACKELKQFATEPDGCIRSSGSGCHKVYVKCPPKAYNLPKVE